jgi:hypothetical protein
VQSNRVSILAKSLVVVGIATIGMCFFPTHPKESLMGYSNGKECYEGECRLQPTLAKCVSCCGSRCPQWVEGCIDACLAGFPTAKAMIEIGDSADLINSGHYPDYPVFCRSVMLLKEGQRSQNSRIRTLCIRLAEESERITGKKFLLAVR